MTSKPWDGVRGYLSAFNSVGLSGDDADRVRAYGVYESFYHNPLNAFRLVQRGEDAIPIYLLSVRRIVETVHRFLCVHWDYIVNPERGTPDDRSMISELFRRLFVREQMYAKFSTQKRFGLIRGDAFWHITANPLKPLGRRISIRELNPEMVFAILDSDGDVSGYHIVDITIDPRNPQVNAHRRQTYVQDPASGQIVSSLKIYELGKWDDRVKGVETKLIAVTAPDQPLPDPIDQLPVYHVKNARDGGLWGSSEARGAETIIAALNQSVSDQDLALAIQGLGVYWTDSGPALDSAGNEVNVDFGPARIIEVSQGATFARVSGVSSGLPGIEHMNFLEKSIDSGIGIPDVAVGRVDVGVAQSGIALQLQLAPLLARNAEKEQEILGVMDQMLYDMATKWFVAYEEVPFDTALSVEVASVVGDPMPRNREAEISEIITLVTSIPPLITIQMAQRRLAELGYVFPDNATDVVLSEAEQLAKARSGMDDFMNRYRSEIGVSS